MPTVGEVIRRYRTRMRPKLSQEKLGELIGKDQNYVSFVETGRIKVPSRPILEDMARVLGIPREEWLAAAGWGEREEAMDEPPQAEPSLRTLPEELRRLETIIREGRIAIETELTVDREESPVRYLGRVPADGVRWMAAVESGEMQPVWERFLAGRSPNTCIQVRASGNCLMRDGIIDGDMVLLEVPQGRTPQDGQIVLVRFQDETSLKHWHRTGDWIELRDGEGQVVHRFSSGEEFEVIGLAVMFNNRVVAFPPVF